MGLTPLIDVVFLLLIFFMLASTFYRFSYMPLSTASPGAGAASVSEVVLVRVHPDARIDVNGEVVSLAEVTAHLDALAQRGRKSVVIKVMPKTRVQHLISLLDRARRSSLDRISVVR